jgi:hypothetical protein
VQRANILSASAYWHYGCLCRVPSESATPSANAGRAKGLPSETGPNGRCRRGQVPARRIRCAPMEASTTGGMNSKFGIIVVVIATVLILAVAAVAIVGLSKSSSNKTTIKRLEAEVHALQAKTGAQGHNVATELQTLKGEFASSHSAQALSDARVARLVSCVPELQSELGGLKVEGTVYETNVSRDSFYISNPTNVSHECQSILYGTGG